MRGLSSPHLSKHNRALSSVELFYPRCGEVDSELYIVASSLDGKERIMRVVQLIARTIIMGASFGVLTVTPLSAAPPC